MRYTKEQIKKMKNAELLSTLQYYCWIGDYAASKQKVAKWILTEMVCRGFCLAQDEIEDLVS